VFYTGPGLPMCFISALGSGISKLRLAGVIRPPEALLPALAAIVEVMPNI
jgi:hypothetical protein